MDEGVYVTLDELVRLGLKAKGFSFLPKQPVYSLLSGRHTSKFRGRGMDFSEMKQYSQGDDTRQIDWRATRRTGKPYVRLYNEERDRNVWVLLSQRNSMFFASKGSMKSVQAAKAASLALFRTLSLGDRVGGIVYNDVKLQSFKPQRSRNAVMAMLHEIVEQNSALNANSTKTDHSHFSQVLKIVSHSAKHDDLVVLIGDGQGFDDESAKRLSDVARHNDILAILISDAMEREIQAKHNFHISDGDSLAEVNVKDAGFAKNFTSSFQAHLQHLQDLSKRHNIVLMQLSTEEDVLTQIQKQLGYHPKRKR